MSEFHAQAQGHPPGLHGREGVAAAGAPPTGKLMEAIIESVDEFYSENLAQEVVRGMREATSWGFWVTPDAPYGYRKVYVQDGSKKRPRLAVDQKDARVVRRIFEMALQGKSSLDITKTLNSEGIASPKRETVAQEQLSTTC